MSTIAPNMLCLRLSDLYPPSNVSALGGVSIGKVYQM